MRAFSRTTLSLILFSLSAFSQTYPFVIRNFAGTFPLGDGGRAEDALLYFPNAVVPDSAGNLYILDALNARIRKMGSDGRISTLAVIPTYGYDMKLASDGSLYVGGIGLVLKVSSSGAVAIVAGNGRIGFAGDNGPAADASSTPPAASPSTPPALSMSRTTGIPASGSSPSAARSPPSPATAGTSTPSPDPPPPPVWARPTPSTSTPLAT